MISPSMSQQVTTVHWKETIGLSGNPYNLKPRPGMLTPSGETVLRSFKTTGRYAKNNQETTWLNVHYDKEYVTEWLLKHVVDSFPGITHVQMRELMVDALKLRRKRLEEAKNGKSETVRFEGEETSEDDI